MKIRMNHAITASALVCWAGVSQSLNAETVRVSEPIGANTTWVASNEYLLSGFVYVLDGATLTIEPGTVIKAKPGSGADTSCLIVTRGGKINAAGTRAKPIIFTSEADDVNDSGDLPLYTRGLWGGVVLLGKSVLNTTVDTAGNAATPKHEVFEGLPDAQVNGQFVNRFGGGDDNDNSGVLRYVSIRHAGIVFQPNKELNALSLGAVGRGTTIEYVEAFAAADDGFEFFGGTVNTKYLVSAFNDDDAFDIDQGYRGKNQFWFAIQEPGKKDNGGEWNGEPNTIAVGAAPIANYEIYNATWIGAGTNTTSNRGLFAREYAAPKVYNSILTEFGGSAVRIDSKSKGHLDSGLLDIRDNLFWNFATNGVPVALGEGADAQVLFTDAARNNLNLNPMLRGISRSIEAKLDPRPAGDGPAFSSPRTTPNDGFYTSAPYKGAFGLDEPWLSDWTFLDAVGVLADFSAERIVQVKGPIATNTTWTADKEYVLNGFIYVLEGATLTIESGTVIKARPGSGADTSCLIVTRGGKINASGTIDKPIIFTAEADDVKDPNDLPLLTRGLWGGVVLLGKSMLNTTVDAAGNAATPKYEVFEGLPDAQVNGQFVNRFGGGDDNDNSGVLRYVSIRHAGIVFQPNKELNALSLGAVGRGTTIEYVEAFAAADDGFEFFGGTVNTKYLVSAFNDDDAFDIDQGYRGKNQFWFAIQEPGKKDNGGEWNGEPLTIAVGAAPIANYEIYNATWIGAGTNTTSNRGLFAREYAAPKVYNSILTEFGGSAVRIDSKSKGHLDSGLLDIRDNLFWNFATNGVPVALGEGADAQVLFTDAARNNLNLNPMLRGISRATDGKLDPRPMAESPALASARPTPVDGFYQAAAFKGAFSTAKPWVSDWTFLDAAGVLADIVTEPVAPVLEITNNQGTAKITFLSESGRTYQLQERAEIGAGSWVNVGTGQPGTGSTLVMRLPLGTEPTRLMRVVVQ